MVIYEIQSICGVLDMANKKSVFIRKNVSRFGKKVLSAMMRENAMSMGWPQRSGKVILTLALDRLVHHYQGDKKGAP